MNEDQRGEQPPKSQDPDALGKETQLLILGSGGAGRTSVEAVRPQDGLVLWAYDRSRELSEVLCGSGSVYVSTRVEYRFDAYEPARIAALRARDGTELWRTDAERVRTRVAGAKAKTALRNYFESFSLKQAKQVAEGLRLTGSLELARAGETVLASNHDAVFGFDVRDGELRWSVPPVRPASRPYVLAADSWGRFYVHGESMIGIQAWNALTGRMLWSATRPKYVSRVVAGPDVIYVSHTHRDETTIGTLAATEGSLLRSFSLPHGPDVAVVLLTITTDGRIYCLRDRRLVATRLVDEQELWRGEQLEALAKSAGAVMSTVEIADAGSILAYAFKRFEDQASTLYVGAIDRDSGETRWKWQSPKLANQAHGLSVVVVGGIVCVSTHDGIYAFQGSDGRLLWKMPRGFDRLHMLVA